MNIKILMIGLALLAEPALAENVTSTSRAMAFAPCVALIDETARQLGATMTILVSTSELKMVRIHADDGGSVLVTCSKPDSKMAMTTTTDQ